MVSYRTWVEVRKSALRANFRTIASLLPKTVKIAPVVKANAYGHGMLETAKTLQPEPIWGFCVASGDEALELRPTIKKKLLVMSSWRPAELTALIRDGVHVVAWDLASAKVINRVAGRVGKRANVHVKIDTGAGRIGLRAESMPGFADALRRLSGIRCRGVFSHFADSEENGNHFTELQLTRFQQGSAVFGQRVERHIACTAAALRYPKSWCSFIRLGLGLYGLWPSLLAAHDAHRRWPRLRLQPVLQWITTLLQVKDLPAGTPVGYGLSFRTKRRTRLGVLPVGYWDGYDRSFSNRAGVLIHGRRAPVIGRVCMNLTMVDLTGLPSVHAGERVTLLGEQGRTRLTADDLAAFAHTINYEIVARINPRLPRVSV